MKEKIVEAYEGRGTKDDPKRFIGKRTIKEPETLREAEDEYGAEAVLKGFMKSHVIDVQRQIRAGAEGPSDKAKYNAIIAKAKAEKAAGDPTLYDKLVELGVIAG